MDWWDFAVASTFWLVGILLARSKGYSRAIQFVFTFAILGPSLLGLVLFHTDLQQSGPSTVQIGALGVGLFSLVWIFSGKQYWK